MGRDSQRVWKTMSSRRGDNSAPQRAFGSVCRNFLLSHLESTVDTFGVEIRDSLPPSPTEGYNSGQGQSQKSVVPQIIPPTELV